jgi:hypothetical protein
MEIMSKSNSMVSSNQPSVLGSVPPKVWLYVIGIPLVIGTAYFGLVRPILIKLGALESPEDEAFDKVNDLTFKQPFWSRSYYLTINKGLKPLTETQSSDYSQQLWYAMKGGWTGWGTDESKIYGVFRNIGSKAGISQVSEKYYNTKQSDLVADLQSELDAEELAEISKIISLYK